jgi:hypothetical protein
MCTTVFYFKNDSKSVVRFHICMLSLTTLLEKQSDGLVKFEKKFKWKGSNCKQSARWQHISWLKASAFCIW